MKVIQVCREIRAGGGVSGVAFNLEKEFLALGVESGRVTWVSKNDAPAKSRVRAKLAHIVDVVAFTFAGTWAAKKAKRHADVVTICHGDALAGDIYVNHGLHAAMILDGPAPWTRLIRNPLHLFLLAREYLRHWLQPHKKVVCFAAEEAETMLRFFPRYREKLLLIPNGVDVARFRPARDLRDRARGEFQYQAADRVAAFVGHEFDRKGLAHLIHAMSHLPMSFKLLVIGGDSGAAVSKYARLAQDLGVAGRVTFAGRRSDVEACMNAADLFVLPSAFEAWPLVGLEAMACGKPALMTDVGGVPAFLRDGVNGFFITQDSRVIAERIKGALSDQDRYDSMAKAARCTAEEYAWSVVAARYLQASQLVGESA